MFVPYRLCLQIEHVSTVKKGSGRMISIVFSSILQAFSTIEKVIVSFDGKLHFQCKMMEFHKEKLYNREQ